MSVFVLQQMSKGRCNKRPLCCNFINTDRRAEWSSQWGGAASGSIVCPETCFPHGFISRAGSRLGANKRPSTALFWVIGCKTTHFQLRWGKAKAFLKRWRSRPRHEGWSCERRRQIAARHWRVPSATFINYSNLFPLSVSNAGRPSAAFVFLKAFFY